MKITAITTGLGLLFASTSFAVIELRINPNEETFAFFGSDEGNMIPFSFSGGGNGAVVQFRIDGLPSPPTQDSTILIYNDDLTFTTSPVGTTPGSNFPDGRDAAINVTNSGGVARVIVSFYAEGVFTIPNRNPVTITTLGAERSYAGFSSVEKEIFESTIGIDIPLTPGFGTGYDPISVVAVPEPEAIYFSVIGVIAFGLAVMRRRRKS
ncbi:MAG: hypothetical protein AAGJ81_08615 [Verrucomicrobiota bacterium]